MPRRTRSKARTAVFQRQFLEDLRHWVRTDHRVALRCLDLVEAALRAPAEGIGKPERLEYLGGRAGQVERVEHEQVQAGT